MADAVSELLLLWNLLSALQIPQEKLIHWEFDFLMFQLNLNGVLFFSFFLEVMMILLLLKNVYIGENAQERNLHNQKLQRNPPKLTTKENVCVNHIG